MKVKLSFLFLWFLPIFLFGQQDSSRIYELINRYKHKDSILAKKLSQFAASGIEKTLPLGNITPDSLINAAKEYLGVKHKMGGTDKNGIDCSGLLLAAFRDVGVSVPHGSEAMAHYGKIIIDKDSLRRGDLVFFIKTYNTPKLITHSGIYLGNGKFIHTSYSRGVVISDLSANYYRNHFIFGTRVFTHKKKSTDKPVHKKVVKSKKINIRQVKENLKK